MPWGNPDYNVELWNDNTSFYDDAYSINYNYGNIYDYLISYFLDAELDEDISYDYSWMPILPILYTHNIVDIDPIYASYLIQKGNSTHFYGNYGSNVAMQVAPLWAINDSDASIYANQLILNTNQSAMKDIVFSGEYLHKQDSGVYPEFKVRDSLGNHVATISKKQFYMGQPGRIRVYLNHILNDQTTTSNWVMHTDYTYGTKSDRYEFEIIPSSGVSDLSNFLFQIRNGTPYFDVDIVGISGISVSSDVEVEAHLLAYFGTIGDIEDFDVYLIDSHNSLILSTFKSLAGAIKIGWDRFYDFLGVFNPANVVHDDIWKWETILDSNRFAKVSIDRNGFTISSVVYTNTDILPHNISTNILSTTVTTASGFVGLNEGQAIRKPNGTFLGYIASITNDGSLELYANATSTYAGAGIATTGADLSEIASSDDLVAFPNASFINVNGEQILYRANDGSSFTDIVRSFNGVIVDNLVGVQSTIWNKKYLAEESDTVLKKRFVNMLRNDCSPAAMKRTLEDTATGGASIDIWDLYSERNLKCVKNYDRGWLASIINSDYKATNYDVVFIKRLSREITSVFKQYGKDNSLVIDKQFGNVPSLALGAFVYLDRGTTLVPLGHIIKIRQIVNYTVAIPSGGVTTVPEATIIDLDRTIHPDMEDDPLIGGEIVQITLLTTNADSMTVAQHGETLIDYYVDYSGYWQANLVRVLLYETNPYTDPDTRRFVQNVLVTNNEIVGEFPFFVHTEGYGLPEAYIRDVCQHTKAVGTKENIAHNTSIFMASCCIADDVYLISYDLVP